MITEVVEDPTGGSPELLLVEQVVPFAGPEHAQGDLQVFVAW